VSFSTPQDFLAIELYAKGLLWREPGTTTAQAQLCIID